MDGLLHGTGAVGRRLVDVGISIQCRYGLDPSLPDHPRLDRHDARFNDELAILYVIRAAAGPEYRMPISVPDLRVALPATFGSRRLRQFVLRGIATGSGHPQERP